jgi:hypothetical protein
VTLDRYMANRRWWEVAGMTLMLCIGFVANVSTVLIDIVRYESTNEAWEILLWEGSSHFAMGVVVLLMLWFDRLFSIRIDNWRRTLIAHALFTVPWSLAHVTIMYWIRVGTYVAADDVYHWPNWWSEFGYEYLKDFRAYFLFLAVIYLYRFVLRRVQGEAGYLSEGKEDSTSVEIADRFLIKKLGREFLVRVEDIDWIEASGNYVNLHVDGRVYPLRETMTGISERLQPQGFQRVHRSAIVNLELVTEIVPFDSGDGELRLTTDATVPVSRRYKQELRSRAGARSHS